MTSPRSVRRTLTTLCVFAIASSAVQVACSAPTSDDLGDPLAGVSAIQLRPFPSTETGSIAVGGTRTYVVVNPATNKEIPILTFVLTVRDAAGTGPTTVASLVGSNQVSCQSAGRVTLTAKATANPALQTTTTVDCAARSVAIISEPAGKTLVAGSSFTYTAGLREPDGTPTPGGATFTWTASDPTIVQMGTSGNLLAVRPGTVTITAASAGATSATTTLTVTPSAAYLQSSPGGGASDPANSKVNVAVGGTRQYQLVNTSTGAVVTGTLVWSSSNAAVATITGNGGLATCVALGTTVIRGTNGTLDARAVLTCQ